MPSARVAFSGPYPGKICLVAFDPTVDYNIEFVGGIKTAIFGGEGPFDPFVCEEPRRAPDRHSS